MSKIKNGGLDQYGAEPFEQQQFGADSSCIIPIIRTQNCIHSQLLGYDIGTDKSHVQLRSAQKSTQLKNIKVTLQLYVYITENLRILSVHNKC